jgi:hypothetical protein
MFPFTTLLVPLEIARAYSEAFYPGRYVAPKLPASQANPSKVGVTIPINSAKPMSTQFYDTQVSTVYFQVLFTKRNLEAILYKDIVLVTSAMTDSGFASWQISLFIRRLENEGIPKPAEWTDEEADKLAESVEPAFTPGDPPNSVKTIIGLEPENLKYLQVDYHVISTFDRKPPRYDAEQVDALLEIADAIKNKGGPDGVTKKILSSRPVVDPSQVKKS